jgi:hypothetical protein
MAMVATTNPIMTTIIISVSEKPACAERSLRAVCRENDCRVFTFTPFSRLARKADLKIWTGKCMS